MDSTGFEPVAFTFQTEGSAFASRGDLLSPLLHRVYTSMHHGENKVKNDYGLDGIRTRGLHVPNRRLRLRIQGRPRSPLLHRVYTSIAMTNKKVKNDYGLDGIRTRGLHVANATISAFASRGEPRGHLLVHRVLYQALHDRAHKKVQKCMDLTGFEPVPSRSKRKDLRLREPGRSSGQCGFISAL